MSSCAQASNDANETAAINNVLDENLQNGVGVLLLNDTGLEFLSLFFR